MDTNKWVPVKIGSIRTTFWKERLGTLEKIRDLLQVQLAQDVQKLQELKERLERAKHGGGR